MAASHGSAGGSLSYCKLSSIASDTDIGAEGVLARDVEECLLLAGQRTFRPEQGMTGLSPIATSLVPICYVRFTSIALKNSA
jgi:hypothetical protein